ncbi:hypothetical protein [Bosea lathyri]|uniref:Uncharacterized protein n=1 Tax=Bosea lathyri TaxID=1036778 RepID=A0A1H6BL94_9HYPH|nr:hypothetical protein [Bosea lathyri]SEG61225.1 hypothetical protein SAMN04488115_107319 [Bosea lathyri]
MIATVTKIADAPVPDHVTRLWNEYVAAQNRAKETLSIQDGLAAGKAWGRWLRVYEGREPAMGGGIARLSDRRRT